MVSFSSLANVLLKSLPILLEERNAGCRLNKLIMPTFCLCWWHVVMVEVENRI